MKDSLSWASIKSLLRLELRARFGSKVEISTKDKIMKGVNIVFTLAIYAVLVTGIYFLTDMFVKRSSLRFEFLVLATLFTMSVSTLVAIGNVVGSNIFNVFVILGVCALIRPLPLTAGNIRRDIPFGVIVSLLLLALAADSYVFKGAADRIGRIDGIVMLLLYGALMW